MANHHAIGIANAVLEAAKTQGFSIAPMQHQKLVYFCHGRNLDIRSQPLVSDHFEAWQYGPVHPSIYHEFKHFGQGVSELVRILASEARLYQQDCLQMRQA